MASLGRLLSTLAENDRHVVGMVSKLGETRWIIGDEQNFPVHIETLAPPKTILLYATGTRDGGKPVLAPMIETFFLERLCGHSLGSYGISVGPVTLTTYQRILMSKTFSMGKLVTSIFLDPSVKLTATSVPTSMSRISISTSPCWLKLHS